MRARSGYHGSSVIASGDIALNRPVISFDRPLRVVAIGGGTGLSTLLRGLKQFVDNQFAFAGKVLDVQHKFVLDLLDVTKPVTEKVVAQKPATGVRKVTKAPARKRTAAAA